MDTIFEFNGIERRGKYLFALVQVNLGADPDSIGYTNITISLPLTNLNQSLLALREESLSLARASIQTQPIADWMDRQRKTQP